MDVWWCVFLESFELEVRTMNREKAKERMMSNVLNGLALGAFLFLGGLFLTIWSLGLASPVGVPMMIVGLVLPFFEAYRAREGRNWIGAVRGRTKV